jgi:hypothetical protein
MDAPVAAKWQIAMITSGCFGSVLLRVPRSLSTSTSPIVVYLVYLLSNLVLISQKIRRGQGHALMRIIIASSRI